MAEYRTAIIGCGRRGQGRGGAYGIAEAHARAYAACPKTTIVAAADIDERNLRDFCADHGTRGYHDYREMLDKERPDIVSVCTWPPLHAQMTIDAAEAGAQGVWCEKPMTLSLVDADRMLAACEKNHTKLQVNHLRRFAAPFQGAREFIKSGRLGELVRMEAYVPNSDLLSWGTHWVDMVRFLNDDRPVSWVAAQIECRKATRNYGHYVEDHSATYFTFDNNVRAFLELGEGCSRPTGVSVYGSEGFLVVEGANTGRAIVRDTAGWVDLPSNRSWDQLALAALEDFLAAIEDNREPLLGGRSARATTEIIMAAYESAFRRGRVALPLDVNDFPLERLVEAVRTTP